jgi:tetratricopeptide (TPR) repeat protein
LRNSRRLDEGAAFFAALAAADPDNPLAHRALARFLQAGDKLAEAAAQYRRALELDPGLDGVHEMLAHVLDREGQPRQAAAVLEQGLQVFPERQELYQRLAGLYMKMGDAEQEIAVSRRLHERWPQDWKATAQLAWGLATAPDARLRNGPEAVALAEEAARATNRRDPEVLNALAAAYALVGRWDNAVSAALDAAQLASAAGNSDLAARATAASGLYVQHRPYPVAHSSK